MKIAFLFNVRHVAQGLSPAEQEQAEFDEPATVKAIHDAIIANGHECTDIEADEDAYEKLKALKGKVDLAFNIAEGLRGELREAQIPAILEMLGIPYTHSGALADALSLDKTLTKIVWAYYGLPTPKFVMVGKKEKPYVEGLTFPVIVKPNSEGSSKGIFNDSIVEEPRKLVSKVRQIRKNYSQGVIVEEFITGREFTVTVMGNPGVGKGAYILPIVEQNFDILPADYPRLSSFEVKWFFEDTLPDPSKAYICPAKLEPGMQKVIETICIKAFTVLHCRDIARIDLRLDDKGKPHLLEINTLPGMIPDEKVVSYFPVAARTAGWDYNRMVGTIIQHARERLGI